MIGGNQPDPENAIRFPLAGGTWITLGVPDKPLTGEQWDHLMRVLAVMRPGLVMPSVDGSPDCECGHSRIDHETLRGRCFLCFRCNFYIADAPAKEAESP